MLILLRLGAFVLLAAILAAVAVGVLLWDGKVHLLYGWDSAHLGHTVLALLAIMGSSVGSQPVLLRAFGLRLVLASGAPTTLFHRIMRALLFWLLISSPGLFRIEDVFLELPLSTREKIIGSAAAGLALICLPAATILFSRGRSSIHDLLAGTMVIRGRPDTLAPLSGSRPQLPITLVIASYSLLVATLLLAGTLIDWRYRISDVYSAYFRARAPYVASVIRAARANPSLAVDVINQSSPTEDYWNSELTAFLPGLTESFRLRVSPYVLSTHHERLLAALGLMTSVSAITTPTTKWVTIRLYSDQWFGPVALEQGYDFLIDKAKGQIGYAPTQQLFVYGKKRLSLEERAKEEGMPDSVITSFEPKLVRTIEIKNLVWQFPRVDFIARATGPTGRLIGP